MDQRNRDRNATYNKTSLPHGEKQRRSSTGAVLREGRARSGPGRGAGTVGRRAKTSLDCGHM